MVTHLFSNSSGKGLVDFFLAADTMQAYYSPSGKLSMQIQSLKTEKMAGTQKRHFFVPQVVVSGVAVATEVHMNVPASSCQGKQYI